jgi:hypothetical protein
MRKSSKANLSIAGAPKLKESITARHGDKELASATKT